MAEPRHALLSLSLLTPDSPADIRVLLACGCGTETDFTYPAGVKGEQGRSCACGGCGTEHRFTARQVRCAAFRRSLRPPAGEDE